LCIDTATQRLKKLRESKKRKNNIQEQHKVLSQSQLDEDEEEWVNSGTQDEDGSVSDEDNNPTLPQKGKSNAQPVGELVNSAVIFHVHLTKYLAKRLLQISGPPHLRTRI
jgi:hypothetical protein